MHLSNTKTASRPDIERKKLDKKPCVSVKTPLGFSHSETQAAATSARIHESPGPQRRIVTTDRPVNIHVHLPGVTCPACAYLEIANMQDEFARLEFSSAFPLWLETHRPFISERTCRDYQQYGDALCSFFQKLQLRHINSVRGYQLWRWKRGEVITGETQCKYTHHADSVRIKNEINSVLKPMLREAGVWADIERKKFKHLPVPREGSGVALSKEQWGAIFAIAFSKKHWTVAGHCLQIMFRQGVGFGELRRVRRHDLDEEHGKLSIVEGAKNGERVRTVTLVPSALESAKWLLARWVKMGGTSGDQYLLPHKGTIRDESLNRPMVSINFAWNAIKVEWMVRQPKQARSETRQYDARVSAATLLLANKNLSLATIEKALGWTPSSAMRKRYYRADQDMLREALRTLEDGQ